MKKTMILALGVATVLPMQAQLFSHESITGAGFGALTGGLIGHASGRHGWEGAAIGAGAGFLIGSLIHREKARERYYYSPYYAYQAPYYAYTASVVPAAPQTPAVTETTQPSSQTPAPAPSVIQPVSNMAGANSLFGR